jgi:hypothetical protein
MLVISNVTQDALCCMPRHSHVCCAAGSFESTGSLMVAISSTNAHDDVSAAVRHGQQKQQQGVKQD